MVRPIYRHAAGLLMLSMLAASGALSLAGVCPGYGQAKETQHKIAEAAKQEGGFLWYDHFGREEGQAVLAVVLRLVVGDRIARGRGARGRIGEEDAVAFVVADLVIGHARR